MKKKIPLVSIIIPLFNGEKYIEDCIKNLKEQTIQNWEAIFINDGSTDNSLSLLGTYSKNDSRIKIISQQNQGVAVARCNGLDKINGEYFTFLDIDDSLDTDALKQLVETAIHTNSEIIHSGFNFIKEGKIINKQKNKFEQLSQLEYYKKILNGKLGWQLCGRLFKANLLENTIICPTNLKCGEDCAVLVQLIKGANKITSIKNNLYNYHYHSTSASNIRSYNRGLQMLHARDFVIKYLYNANLSNHLKKDISIFELLCLSSAIRKGLSKRDLEVKNSIRRIKIKSLFSLHPKKIVNILFFIFN